MVKIQYNELPKRHVIIDDFLSEKLAKKCLDEFISLKPYYHDATVGEESKHPDCEACTDIRKFHKNSIRDNTIVGLNEIFKGKEYESIIIRSILDALYREPLVNFLSGLDGLFPIINHMNTCETILSRYGKCDFYGIHSDSQINFQAEKRIITLVYYVNKEPVKFQGGELTMYSDDLKDKVTIQPKHNRAVIFESKTLHAVETVKFDGDWEDARWSVNWWGGFDNKFKFK